MRKFGLIGHPIGHSLSPALFKAGYGGKYTYDLIETPDFEEAYARFLADYDGINVTAPFKELALQKADIISEECQKIGATNLMVKTPEGIKAYNSDFRGLCNLLSGKDLKKVLIVGWGGASKAAKAAAESLGLNVTVINRTQYNAEIKPLSNFRKEFLKADIIIYNLPVRINEIEELTRDHLSCCGRKVILEANYRNPSFDNILIDRWKNINPGITYLDGKEWLLAQAVTGYELFTGEQPDSEAMRKVLL